MFEKLEQCPICKNDKLVNYLICKDYLESGESFAIVRCENCSFLITNPRPNHQSINKYYKSTEYISHTNKATSLTNIAYKIARNFTLGSKLKLINSLTNNKTILDIGCGTGEFLQACKKNKWKIYGFEPDDSARNHAINLLHHKIYENLMDIQSIEQVEIITLWHVLEHIHELNETITLLINKLTKTGKIVIAVPNIDSYDAQLYREYWAAYDVPRHLYHFTPRTMKLLLKNHGLKIFNIIPMKLDAFYVSLLSEKYKNEKNNYLKSIITGYKSNVYARKNNNKYSSLIYISGR